MRLILSPFDVGVDFGFDFDFDFGFGFEIQSLLVLYCVVKLVEVTSSLLSHSRNTVV